MTYPFSELVDQFDFGDEISDGRLAAVPIYWRAEIPAQAKLEYLILDDAVEKKLARVMEVTEKGSVPQLAVVNTAKIPVFLPDGTSLLGCKQNRVVNVSILLPPNSTTVIPVSCVEQGRWQTFSHDARPGHLCDPDLRSRMSSDSISGLRETGEIHVDQGKVWSHVDQLLHSTHSVSGTLAYESIFDASQQHVVRSLEIFRYPARATGVVLLTRGRIASWDLFDRPDTLERLWDRLIPAAVVVSQSLVTNVDRKPIDLRDAFARAVRSSQIAVAGIGCGTRCHFGNDGLVGSGLVFQKSLLHLALFERRDGSSID